MSNALSFAMGLLLVLPVPVLLLLALKKLLSRVAPDFALRSFGSGGGQPFRRGIREPRRPRPFSGAGAVALPLPDADHHLRDAV
jgi:hypothetical protein